MLGDIYQSVLKRRTDWHWHPYSHAASMKLLRAPECLALEQVISWLGDNIDNCTGMKLGLTVWGEKGSLLGLGAEDTMNTSSAPRSSSVKLLQERSTSAFWEMSPPAPTIKTQKQDVNTKYIENTDNETIVTVLLNCKSACIYELELSFREKSVKQYLRNLYQCATLISCCLSLEVRTSISIGAYDVVLRFMWFDETKCRLG